MSTSTLAPWDRTRFEKLKASISDEADFRARLASWDADLIANTKALSEAKLTLTQATESKASKYRSLRALIATESGESVKAHLFELFQLDEEIRSANGRIRDVNTRGMSFQDIDNLVRQLESFLLCIVEQKAIAKVEKKLGKDCPWAMCQGLLGKLGWKEFFDWEPNGTMDGFRRSGS